MERVKIPKKLLERMRRERRQEIVRHVSASQWQGEYGYGAGRAHPSVEFARCPQCGQPPGKLCLGVRGPHLGVHFRRCNAYRDLKRAVRQRLEREQGACE